MARNIFILLPKQNLPFSATPLCSSLVLIIAVFSLFSVVMFLCSSHNSKKSDRAKDPESSEKKLLSKLNSGISSKAHLMVKMISWRKMQEDDDDDYESEEAVWRKTIIMGERCRPLNFSGKIEYDAQGNLVPESHHLDLSGKIVPFKN
ncbi:hypothetical protein P3X46_016186 [Hevea brasiliensis]|uniref:Transmembrane protein n=1 Tax=Hevea brasiliensis TaxID=3981 RepID=A0ABQ9M081_HEVBR|nr:hypothetical protein P3X46_016186 [Hevea brasiliensis]